MINSIDYYDINARAYVTQTVRADMHILYEKFEKYLPYGSAVLDAGCGSGRDTLYFLKKGYDVTAVDASKELCRIATSLTRHQVLNIRFQDLQYKNKFDGIWACASLLHLDISALNEVFGRLYQALKETGVFYASWKYGTEERFDGERYYNDMTEEKLLSILDRDKRFSVIELWQSEDVIQNRKNQGWLNVILRKQ